MVRYYLKTVKILWCIARNRSLFSNTVLADSRVFKIMSYFIPVVDSSNLHDMLSNLGVAFIKLGQVLSSRPDIVGQDIADYLSNLQDRVPPFASEIAKKIIEKEFNKNIAELFKHFVEEPIASASISQVHYAVTHNNEQVAIKFYVLRSPLL